MRSVLTGLALATTVATISCTPPQWQPSPCPQCPEGPPPVVAGPGAATPTPSGPPTLEEATAFMKDVDKNLRKLWVERERAAWIQMNFITKDTDEIAAEAEQETMEYLAATIKKATRFDPLRDQMPADLRRQFHLLKLAGVSPAPSDSAKTKELATILSQMGSTYGKGKYCPNKDGNLRKLLSKERGKDKKPKFAKALTCTGYGRPGSGVSLGALTGFMANNRDEKALLEAWAGWRMISPPMREDFKRYVALSNEGAKEIGFTDVGQLWRSGYDMSADEFRKDSERLYNQVKPFYNELHCYMRDRLQKQYGDKVVRNGQPIPAHLFGNMWSQTWGNLFKLAEPYPGQGSVDVTKALERQKYDEVKMVKTAERFFTSIGLDPLPKTFWERSLFKKPADRDVVCHASAWDVHYNDDLRIKMCIQITEEELGVVHHELGHNYYFHYYYQMPMLFQSGANDGFHEAIGDAIALSITPDYLKAIGLIDRVQENEKAEINYLMKMALDKVAFLPFGKLIDEYRWDVFAGKIKPGELNAGWWKLRTKYQGIVPPVARSESDFDPGAKYHVPGNVPYTRYFLAFVYQFQFQRALCRAAGHTGPLHKCSIYNNKQAGKKLRALLAMGASKPWQDALQAMSGERKGDAGALLEYFQPLRGWLKEQIKDSKCGW